MGYKDFLPKNYTPATVFRPSSSETSAVKDKITKDNQKRKYGVEVPTVEDITKQASVIKEHGTDAEVSNYLGGAISDGVISANDANGIFRQVTGSKNNLYSPENIKNVNAAIANAMGVPKANPAVQNPYAEKYGELNHEDVVKAYNDLYAKYAETGDVSLVEELEYLRGRSEETAGEDVLGWKRDRAEAKANEAWNDYEYYSDGTAVATPNSVYGNKNEGKAKANYNAYKSFASEADRYGDLYDEAKTKRIIAEFEEPAMGQSDFESKSQYDGEYYGVIHDYVNGKHTYSEVTQTGIWSPEEQATAYAQEAEYLPYTYVTEKERKVFNYLIKTDRDKALEYIEALKPELNRRSAEALSKETAKMAEEAPFGASVISVPLGIAGGIKGSGELLKSMVTGEEIDANAPAFAGNIMSEAIRGTVAENINNPVGKFFYNIGMSMADSVAVMPFGGAGTVFLGMNAAVSEGRKTALEGGSKSEILTKGIAAGVFEALFEKFSIDKLLSPKAVGSASKVLKTILQQGGIEASEEFCTSLANNIVEDLAMGGESQFNTLTRKYIEEGYSHSEAQSKAALEMAGDTAIETLSGFVSGLLFGGAGATMNYAQATNTGKAVNAQGNKNALIDYAKMQDSDSTSYKDAVKLSKKDNVKNAEVGALLQQMIIDKQISEADANKLVSEGFNGLPLDEAEQAYFYAGANGMSAMETARMLSDLDVDSERAIKAWQMGAEKRMERNGKADTSAPTVTTRYARDISKAINETAGATVNPITRKVKPFEVKTEETPAIQNDGNVVETLAVQNAPVKAVKFKGEAYNEAVSKYKTAENAKDFDYAYTQGFNRVKPSEDINLEDVAISSAYLAGVSDSRAVVSSRANFEARTPGLNLIDTVSRDIATNLDDSTRATINNIGKKLGVEIVLTNKNNEIAGGNTKHSRNSSYNFKNGVVTINVDEIHIGLKGRKLKKNELVRFILAHEGTHRLQETSPEAYAEMEKIALAKSNMTLEEYMKKWNISDEAEARGEIVADYFGDLLSTKAEVKALLNENRSLWDKILEVIDWLIYKLKGTGIAYNDIVEARELFRQALNEADATVWGEEVREDESGSFGENEVVLSRSTYDEEGRTKLINWLNNSKLEKSERDRIVSQLDFIYDITTKYTDKFTVFGKWSQAEVLKGEDGKPVLSVVKQNGEYKLNLDFSSVCSKRRPLDTIITKMVESGIINDVLIDENGLVKLNQIINKHGLTVACALCYVEGRRYRQEKVAKDFANLYNSLVDRYNENPTDFAKRILSEQPLNDKGGHKETVDYKIAKHLETHPDERKHIDYTDFMSSEGFTKVAKENPELLKLYNSKKGTGGPKAAFADVQYLNEILSKKTFNAKTAFAVGGVRIQSFSDFVPRLVFDYAQMVADLDAKKLPAHAYTKVVDFVKIFGLTGIKINMSLIPKYVKGGVAPGLDADGNYAWDAESFDFDLAIEIQSDEGYSKNCGTIAVGVSYGHIMKLLADDRIKMVIPYHKSGINPIVAKMLEISAYEDYTESQTTKHNDGTALTKEEKKREFNFNEVMHNRGLTAKEAADEYLKWCDKNDYRPKFAEFRDNENYYKLLADFSCYDVNGEYSAQTAVKMNYPDNVDALIGESIGKDQSNEDAILREADGIIEEFSAWNETRDDGIRWSRSEPEKTFTKGEAPRRDIDVPSEVDGKKVMRGARTTAEAKGINEDYAFNLVEEIRNGNFTYEVSSNKAVALKATNEVNENYDQAKAKWDGIIMSGKRVTPEDIALGEALLVEASHRKSVEETLKINAEVAMLATEAGQVVQAMRILKRLSPDGQLRYLEVVTDRINAERQKTKGKKYNRLIESENEVANANKKYQEADKKVKDLEKKSEEILNTINQLQSELESEDRIANLEEQKKALIKEIAMLKKELAKESDASGKEKIREQIRILEEDIKENASQLKDALDEKSRLVSERNAMGKELTVIKNAKKATDNAVEKLAGDMALLENEIADLDSQLEKATKFKKELEEELSKLRKERRTIKDKIKRREDSSEKAFVEIEPLENEIAELKEKLELANKALDEVTERRNALRDERNKLRSKLYNVKSQTKKRREQIAQLLDDLYNTDILLEQAKANRKAVNEKRQKVNEIARYAQSKAGKVVLPDDLKAKILQAQNEDELKAAMEIATDYIAANVKTTWAEKIRAWRYLAMLGNFRTIFRNFAGNVFMNIPVIAKNVFAYPMEAAFVPINNAIVRAKANKMAEKGISQETIDSYLDRSIAYKTQTLKVFKKRSEDIKKFVKESWDTNLKVAMEGGKYDSTSMADEIESKRVIFKNKAIEAWRKVTNWAMESGDLVFVQFNYKQALTRFMLANNLNPETITQAERAKAEAYAIKEAQEATFRDKSKLAESLNIIKKTNWATELLLGGLFPFTKTPINVMKRSFEYSPLGLINTASDFIEAVKGTKNVTDVINSAAKMLSGSALVALGAYLAAQGFLRSTGDDEDEEYDYLAGEQDYAITIGDIRYPIDWASPTAIPLLLGASLHESYFKNDGGVKKKYFIDENGKPQEATAYMNFVDSLNKAMTLFNPVFEATYLSGFADAIETGSQFSSMPGESIIAFGTSSVLSFGKQFIPTAVGQFARIIDPIERRNNEVDQTSGIPRYAQKGVAKIKNSIPWLRESSTPYVDAWGRIPEVKDEAKDYFWSAVENLISPGYYQRVKEDDITKELWRLQKTEDGKGKNVFPDAVGNSYTQTKDKIEYTYVFNPEQKNERQMAESDAYREFAETFLNSDIYSDLTDAEKIKVLAMLNSYSEAEGIKAVYKDFETGNSTVQKMYAAEAEGISPEAYALWKVALNKADKPNKNGNLGSFTNAEKAEAIEILKKQYGIDIDSNQAYSLKKKYS